MSGKAYSVLSAIYDRLTDKDLYEKARAVLELNKSERHIRGGLATRKKYKQKEK